MTLRSELPIPKEWWDVFTVKILGRRIFIAEKKQGWSLPISCSLARDGERNCRGGGLDAAAAGDRFVDAAARSRSRKQPVQAQKRSASVVQTLSTRQHECVWEQDAEKKKEEDDKKKVSSSGSSSSGGGFKAPAASGGGFKAPAASGFKAPTAASSSGSSGFKPPVRFPPCAALC